MRELLEVMQPSTKSWSNGDLATLDNSAVSASVPAADVGESDDEYAEIPSKRKKAKQEETVPTVQDIHMSGTEAVIDAAVASTNDTEAVSEKQPLNDDDWLRSKTSRLLDITDDIDSRGLEVPTSNRSLLPAAPPETEKLSGDHVNLRLLRIAESEEQPKDEPEENVPESNPVAEEICKTGRLFVRNLPYTATEDDLRDAFSPFGPLTEVITNIFFPTECFDTPPPPLLYDDKQHRDILCFCR